MVEKRTVKLRSSDSEIFEVDEAVALQSQMLKNFLQLEDLQPLEYLKEHSMEAKITNAPFEAPIPLPKVSSKILAMVIEYCKYHAENPKTTENQRVASEKEVKAWDASFVNVDSSTLYDLFLVAILDAHTLVQLSAAHYLAIHSLMVLTTKNIYDLKMKGKPYEEIKKAFKLGNNSREELRHRSGENAWAHDKYEE